jgi:hypothetical protein
MERIEDVTKKPLIRTALSAYDLYSLAAALIGGAYVMWRWGTSHMMGPLVATLTAFTAFMCLRIALEPEVAQRVLAWGKGKLGLRQDKTPTPHAVPPPAETTAVDHLCMLWLYQQQIPRFDTEIERAKKAKTRVEAAFAKAMEGPLDDVTQAELNNQIFVFMDALTNANDAYRICLHIDRNLALNPRSPSQIPIEGLEKLPNDELKREFRAFHDRVESMTQKEGSMRESLVYAANATQQAISKAAHRAIDDAKQR